MRTWTVALALLLSLPGADAQPAFRGTGAAEFAIDGIRWRFHAFEFTAEGSTQATATWRVGSDAGWLRIDALLIEPDVDAAAPEDPAFGILSLSFYVDPATGQVAASPLHRPVVEFVPNQATYEPVFQGLEDEVVIVVTAFSRHNDVLQIGGTIDALLGRSDGVGVPSGTAAAITLRGVFELREVVPGGD
jgi:hypothetical protein